jgi:hypothetical protein
MDGLMSFAPPVHNLVDTLGGNAKRPRESGDGLSCLVAGADLVVAFWLSLGAYTDYGWRWFTTLVELLEEVDNRGLDEGIVMKVVVSLGAPLYPPLEGVGFRFPHPYC